MADIGTLLGSAQTVAGAGSSIMSTIDKLRGKTPPQAGGSATGSISAFRSNLINQGLMRNNRFLVRFAPPALFKTGERSKSSAQVEPLLSFVCESGNMPGVSLATSEIKRHGVGPTEKRPYSANFIDMNLTFLVDGNGVVHNFFRDWIDGIVRFDKLITTPDNSLVQQPYEVEYRKNYVVTVEIWMYNEKMQQVYMVDVFNAFPVYMGDVSLSWSSTNEFVRLPVSFSYTSWTSESLELPGDSTTGKKPGVMEKLMAAGSALSLLSSIRKPNSIGDLVNVVGNSTSGVTGLTKVFK